MKHILKYAQANGRVVNNLPHFPLSSSHAPALAAPALALAPEDLRSQDLISCQAGGRSPSLAYFSPSSTFPACLQTAEY